MASGTPIPQFDASRIGFKEWREIFESYCQANDKTEPAVQLATLKYLGGLEICRLLRVLPPLNEENVGLSVSLIQQNEYSQAINKLDEHFEENRNTHLERAEFQAIQQHLSETARQFVIRLREKAARCEFQDAEERVQEQFVKGVKDDKVRRRAMRQNLSIQELVNEATLNETLSPAPMVQSSVNHIRSGDKKGPGRGVTGGSCHHCRRPGHVIRDCPDRKAVTCYTCGLKGHTSRRCYKNLGSDQPYQKDARDRTQRVRYLETSPIKR